MALKIHPTAIVSSSAVLHDNVEIGPYSIVEDEAVLGEGTVVGNYALIDKYTKIGKNCKIYHHTSVGTPPQDLKYNNERTCLEIGDNTVIREFADLNRGTVARGKTEIGSNVLIMAYVHVAHDCIVGDRVILANAATLAGHVEIEHDVIVGGLVPMHQFIKIGAYSIIGGGWRVPKDVPPFITAAGEPLSYKGLNLIGLKRKGFVKERTDLIKKVYRVLYQSNYNTVEALDTIKSEFDNGNEDVKRIVTFVENAERGIIPGFKRKK